MATKPILMIHGGTPENIQQFDALIRKGTQNTLLIQTRYIVRTSEGEQLVEEEGIKYVSRFRGTSTEPEKFPLDSLSDTSIKASVQAALVNKQYDIYIVDKNNIEEEDYKVYLYIAKTSSAGVFTVINITLGSRANGIPSNGKFVIFISGEDTDGLLIKSIAKASQTPVIISSEILSNSETVEEKDDQQKLTPTEIRDRKFFDALSQGQDLVIVQKTLLEDLDFAMYQRTATTYRYTELWVDIMPKNGSSPAKPSASANGKQRVKSSSKEKESSKWSWKKFRFVEKT